MHTEMCTCGGICGGIYAEVYAEVQQRLGGNHRPTDVRDMRAGPILQAGDRSCDCSQEYEHSHPILTAQQLRLGGNSAVGHPVLLGGRMIQGCSSQRQVDTTSTSLRGATEACKHKEIQPQSAQS